MKIIREQEQGIMDLEDKLYGKLEGSWKQQEEEKERERNLEKVITL